MYLRMFLLAIVLLASCTTEHKKEYPNSGDYLGQSLSADRVEIFADGIISTNFNERDITFSPDRNELFYTLKGNSFHTLVNIKRDNNIWGEKAVAPFSGKYSDLEPCFSYNGKKLFFVSNRPTDNSKEPKDYDIWYVEKTDSGWGKPVNPGAPLNSEANEFYPSITKNGKIYFCAKTNTTIGGEDLFYSEFIDGKYQPPVNLGDSINTARDEFNAFISPKENYIIYTSTGLGAGLGGGDLWISFKNLKGEWKKAVNMGEKVNSPLLDFCPSVTPDGKFLFFTSNRTNGENHSSKQLGINEIIDGLESTLNGSQNIYWISSEVIDTLN